MIGAEFVRITVGSEVAKQFDVADVFRSSYGTLVTDIGFLPQEEHLASAKNSGHFPTNSTL
jgi:hypothetical protein